MRPHLFQTTGAFPRPYSFEGGCDGVDHYEAQEGIDVRTYIATAVLAGLRASADRGGWCSTNLVGLAVADADALIAELNK